ncbi:putative sodium-coupled neutral amino acid transporter 10 [Leptopilina boulardi]|uniref:putative sodium-coupled neutral amino acid transporter 10 n=1 Tax=Leptopilina boulardi TaxID=63433 RepID=UPI0021F53704|nr:putative sodium-coupled neutral amino acid transporter 10 [Leptopilina boulardi]
MISHLSHVMTLANGAIGVSVLAMPFCFKQCGIILAILLLLVSSILSRLACHFLLKSAVMSRRRNFEFLAFHAFGRMGKFFVELFIIGFLLGTCIAFFVVVGDLGPAIIGKVIDKNPENIRTSLLITTGTFIVLPLGLLRNIDSLSSISTATIVFYFFLVLKVMGESTQHIFAGDWYDHVFFWRPAGILQCLPIFSMALFCQTQLFEIYESVPNVSLEKMNEIVRGALNICTIVYISVGLFGYIACCTQPFTGNILMSFEPSPSSEVIKLFFVFSVAFSFPLVIFPCRASLNSLLFRRAYLHDSSSSYMPETRFRFLTFVIVSISLIMGILIPNIEFVLGIVGATIGVMICLIFPATFFISISSKNTNERLLAQVIAFVGLLIMILGTYVNLHAKGESLNPRIIITTDKSVDQMNNLPFNLMKDDIPVIPKIPKKPNFLANDKDSNALPEWNLPKNIPIPALPKDIVTPKSVVQSPIDENVVINSIPETNKVIDSVKESKIEYKIDENIKKEINPEIQKEENLKLTKVKDKIIEPQKNENLIHSDAIKKEETELAAAGELSQLDDAQRHEELKRTLEKYKKEQREMMKEQKEILKDIKQQQLELQKKKEEIPKVSEQEKKSDKIKEKEEEIKVINIETNRKNTIQKENIFDKKELENEKKKLEEKEKLEFKEKIPEKKIEKIEEKKDIEVKTQVKPIIIENEILNKNSPLDSEKISSDHILNALTKKIVNNVIKEVKQEKNISQKNHSIYKKETNVNNEIIKLQEYAIPIALKMNNNQTKTYNNTEKLTDKKKVEVGRDILENNEREKRDIHDTVNNETNKIVNNDVKKICEKDKIIINENIKQDPLNVIAIKDSLIVTNNYLSQPNFVDKISIESNNLDLNEKIVKLNKRDLKYINLDEHEI